MSKQLSWTDVPTAPKQLSWNDVTPTAPASPPPTDNTTVRQLLSGASPMELGERFKGAARAVGRVGMGALQYGQYLAGAKVSPTPLALEPSPDPNQAIGEKIGEAGLSIAAGAATSGASLPVQAATGAMIGGAVSGSPAGAVVGGAIPVVGQAVKELGQYAADKEYAAKLWNAVAKVKAGRQGTQLDTATGEFKTLPGRSMVGADDTKDLLPNGPISNVVKAYLAKPNAATQAAAHTELMNAGTSLGKQLAKVTTPVDITADIPLSEPNVQKALDAVGITPGTSLTARNVGGGIGTIPKPVTNITVTPTEAHALRSDLGARINWNPNVYNDSNEALKEAYFKLGSTLDSVLPESLKPALKRWQESFLFNKALTTTMEKAANNPSFIPPVLKKTIVPALVGGTIGGGAAYAIRNLP